MRCPYIGETNVSGVEYDSRQVVIAVTNAFLIHSCLNCLEEVCYLERKYDPKVINDNTNKNTIKD